MYIYKIQENVLHLAFYNTACFYTGDSLDPKWVRARERPFQEKGSVFDSL